MVLFSSHRTVLESGSWVCTSWVNWLCYLLHALSQRFCSFPSSCPVTVLFRISGVSAELPMTRGGLASLTAPFRPELHWVSPVCWGFIVNALTRFMYLFTISVIQGQACAARVLGSALRVWTSRGCIPNAVCSTWNAVHGLKFFLRNIRGAAYRTNLPVTLSELGSKSLCRGVEALPQSRWFCNGIFNNKIELLLKLEWATPAFFSSGTFDWLRLLTRLSRSNVGFFLSISVSYLLLLELLVSLTHLFPIILLTGYEGTSTTELLNPIQIWYLS